MIRSPQIETVRPSTTRRSAASWFAAVVAALLVAGCGDDPPASEAAPDNLFQRQIERPRWLAEVEAPVVRTADEVSALWQSKKRCCVSERALRANNREFFRACYEAIGRHPDDDELVVMCLWLMNAGAEGDQRRQIRQFLVDHYLDHRGRTDNCASCAPADVVARASRDLASIRLRAGRAGDAAAILERVVDRRLAEISPWVQVELYETLGRIYLASHVDEARRERLRTAHDRLAALAEAGDEAVARRLERLTGVYREVSER